MLHTFSIGELIEAGRIVGPRSFSTGPTLTCGPWSRLRQIQTFEDARQHVNRLANLGAISIKDYKQCTRIQRTWLAEAARRRGVTLTSEGSDLGYFLGLVMTGHAGWEHPVQFVPIYNDVSTFFGQARAHYSAQLIMSDYPTGNAIEYWYGASDLWEDSKLMHWSPWQETASRRSFVKKPARDAFTRATHWTNCGRAGGPMEFCPGSTKRLHGQTCVLTTSGMARPHRLDQIPLPLFAGSYASVMLLMETLRAVNRPLTCLATNHICYIMDDSVNDD